MGNNGLNAFDKLRTGRDVDISYEALDTYLDCVERTYQQAGLDPANSGRSCPGFKTEEWEFQVRIEQSVSGKIIGTHYLFSSPKTGLVHEGDIFLEEGEFDISEGRILTPDSNVTHSGPLDTESTQWLIAYMNDCLAEGCFTALNIKTR